MMLSVVKIVDGVYFLKQDSPIHPLSTSNGYLISPTQIKGEEYASKSLNSILLDVNLEEKGWIALKKFCLEQMIPLPDTLIMTHCHLDHSSHVHFFVEIFEGKIYTPEPEVSVILKHHGFFDVYQIQEMREIPSLMESYHHLKYEILQFGIIPESKITTFNPGDIITYGTIQIQTIPLLAHSIGHVGFILNIPSDEHILFHNSCLGLDHLKINKEGKPKDGFGPWYGFKHSKISDYLKDIDKSEQIFQDCDILTSSHGIIYTRQENLIEKLQGDEIYVKFISSEQDFESPFEYMRRKIQERENMIIKALDEMGVKLEKIPRTSSSSNIISNLLEEDLIFSRKRIPKKQIAAYKFWERYLIINHLKRLESK